MIGLLVLIGLAILTFKRMGKEPEESIVLDKVCTKELKGIAIILVILGHMSIDRHISIHPDLAFAGAWGVTLFLILSGFGLSKSYLVTGVNFVTLLRRLWTILIPYSLVTLVWILIDTFYFDKSFSAKTITMLLLGIDVKRSIDASMWYISMILFWYIAFYLAFRLPTKNYLKVILLFFLALLIYRGHFNLYLQDLSYNWQLSAFSFPLGVIFALYLEHIKKFFQEKAWKYLWIASIPAFFILFIYFLQNIGLGIRLYILSNTFFAFFLISFIAAVRHYQITSKFLLFIGAISFELYLFEGVFMWKYSILRAFENKLISFTLYIVILIAASYLYQKFTNKIKFPLMGSKRNKS